MAQRCEKGGGTAPTTHDAAAQHHGVHPRPPEVCLGERRTLLLCASPWLSCRDHTHTSDTDVWAFPPHQANVCDTSGVSHHPVQFWCFPHQSPQVKGSLPQGDPPHQIPVTSPRLSPDQPAINQGSHDLLFWVWSFSRVAHRTQGYTDLHFPISVQFSSVAQSCPTLCDPMNCSMPGPFII